MISEHFEISDADGAVLDLSDLLKIEIRNDNMQSFVTRWDETVIALTKQPDDEALANLYFRQLDKADQIKQLRAKELSTTEHG